MNADTLLFFDIETLANPEALAVMPEPKAPGNLRDPEKIAAAIADKKAEQIATAALDADLASVLAISMQIGVEGEPVVLIAGDGFDDYQRDERNLIESFWTHFERCWGRCCGYNVIGFDLPFLMRRSFDLGIHPPFPPNLAKFRSEPVCDLMCILYNWSIPSKGLKWVAKRYGLINTAPDVDGSQVATLNKEQLAVYAASDLSLTVQLYRKMSGIYF